MTQNDAPFKWNEQRAKAAQFLAEARLGDEEIAQEVGISRNQITRWKRHPEFAARIAQIVEATAEALKTQGIRRKENRLDNYQRLVDKMFALIDARGAEMAKTEEIAGGETGLLVRDYKGKDADRAVYAFDASLIRELREHQKQAAIEVGEWTEKKDLTSDGKALELRPTINVYASESIESDKATDA